MKRNAWHTWNCNPKETDTIFSAPDTPHFFTQFIQKNKLFNNHVHTNKKSIPQMSDPVSLLSE
jgi:hypothetical protein